MTMKSAMKTGIRSYLGSKGKRYGSNIICLRTGRKTDCHKRYNRSTDG